MKQNKKAENMIGRKKLDRFTLLSLDEGEYYFDDYSAFYYPPQKDDKDIAKM
jgi:hypothetical protein